MKYAIRGTLLTIAIASSTIAISGYKYQEGINYQKEVMKQELQKNCTISVIANSKHPEGRSVIVCSISLIPIQLKEIEYK